MTKRIQTLCSLFPRAKVFADVGCDHGYCTRFMFDNGLCERAYITDISAKSLAKAEALMRAEIASGRCVSVCCDGLGGVPERCDFVLIAGMGGEETVSILQKAYLPEKFVLQPMKNADKVRAYLLEQDAKIIKDFTFCDGKFYDCIFGEGRGGDRYSEFEIRFGRDNLRTPSPDFLQKLRAERALLASLAGKRVSRENYEEILRRKREIDEVLDAIDQTL